MKECNRPAFSFILILFSLLAPPVFAAAETEEASIPLNELRALSEAYYQIKTNYVAPTDDKQLLQAAIAGMVASLDRHSRYLPAREFQQVNADNEGEYAGIGLSFDDHKFGIQVMKVLDDSPAKRAGIKPGMIITVVDGRELKFMSAHAVMSLFIGEVGSPIELTVAAAEFPKPRVIKLRREFLRIKSVFGQWLPEQTGYVAISQFSLKTAEEFDAAIASLRQKGKFNNLILDLRNNPGGVMEVAVELSGRFIADGKLLISSGRTDDANRTYFANGNAPLADMNVVVMINADTASAAEIMAAALKDHGKALLLGQRTYGKGSIQSVIPLNTTSGIKLTSAEYYSPNGDKIQDAGVAPDIDFEVANDKGDTHKGGKNSYNVPLLDDPELLQAYRLVTQQQ